jgi:hypothetical protein
MNAHLLGFLAGASAVCALLLPTGPAFAEDGKPVITTVGRGTDPF